MSTLNILFYIAILFGLSQSILLAVSLWRAGNRNHLANWYLIGFLICTIVLLFGRLRFAFGLDELWMLILRYADVVFYLFGPFLYSYLIKATHASLSNRSFLYYFPAIVYSLLVGLALINFETYSNLLVSGKLEGFLIGTEIFKISFNLYFVVQGLILIRDYQINEHENLSFEQSPIKFFKALVASFGLAFVIWAFMIVLRLLYGFEVQYGLIWICITVSTFILGYYNINHNGLFRADSAVGKIDDNQNRLSITDRQALESRIDNLMANDHVYRNPALTLSEFSELLNASRHDVSWMINNVYSKNFYDFINEFRINDFKQRVSNGELDQMTILGLALDSGFNSKATFNRVFKSVTELTPSQFVKQHSKDH